MFTEPTDPAQPSASHEPAELYLSCADIKRAAAECVIAEPDAARIIAWGYEQRFAGSLGSRATSLSPEQRKGLNAVTVAYYSGAMLMIAACAWFLGDKWEALGARGVLFTTLVYMLATAQLGLWLRKKGYKVGGGLLITVAVCLVPLLVHSVERLTELWVDGDPGDYAGFYPRIHASWIVMELSTVAASLVALKYVRFSFLTAPLAFALWFCSMDSASLIFRETYLSSGQRQWVSVIVGLLTLAFGYWLDRGLREVKESRAEDYAFWCYLFGMISFWGGLTTMDSDSELGRFAYACINVALIWIAVNLRRATFLVFGALGIHIYLGHLAYEVFKDSVLFPFALTLLGLSLILVTVFAQRYLNRGVST